MMNVNVNAQALALDMVTFQQDIELKPYPQYGFESMMPIYWGSAIETVVEGSKLFIYACGNLLMTAILSNRPVTEHDEILMHDNKLWVIEQ